MCRYEISASSADAYLKLLVHMYNFLAGVCAAAAVALDRQTYTAVAVAAAVAVATQVDVP